jgi:hypothetical protein
MAVLTAKARKALPKKSFAIPSKREYPIEDKAHASNAKSRVAQFGTSAEKAKVDAAVAKKFPNVGKTTTAKKKPKAFASGGKVDVTGGFGGAPKNSTFTKQIARNHPGYTGGRVPGYGGSRRGRTAPSSPAPVETVFPDTQGPRTAPTTRRWSSPAPVETQFPNTQGPRTTTYKTNRSFARGGKVDVKPPMTPREKISAGLKQADKRKRRRV